MRTLRLSLAGMVTLVLLSTPGNGALARGADAGAPAMASETLVELSVPSWAFPEDVNSVGGSQVRLDAGTDATGLPTTSQANESMRNRAIVVMSGEFLIAPTTEALLWRDTGAAPEMTPPAESVTLGVGEAIFLPAVPADQVDPAKHLRIANPGTEEATAWNVHAHEGSGSFGGFPPGLYHGEWRGDLVNIVNLNDWVAADEVLIRLTRHTGDPGATFVSSAAPATAAYYVETGEVERVLSGPKGELTERWRAGRNGSLVAWEKLEQTLTVVGEEAASILELVAIPRSSTGG